MLENLSISDLKERVGKKEMAQFVVLNISGNTSHKKQEILTSLLEKGALYEAYKGENAFTFTYNEQAHLLLEFPLDGTINRDMLNLWRMRNLETYETLNLDYFVTYRLQNA